MSPPTAFVPYSAADPMMFQAIIDADFEAARNYLESITNVSGLSDVHTEIEVLF